MIQDTYRVVDEAIAEIVETFLNKGMQLPLILCWVGADGMVLASQWNSSSGEGIQCKILAQNDPTSGVFFPLHGLVVDGQNRAGRVILHPGKPTQYLT